MFLAEVCFKRSSAEKKKKVSQILSCFHPLTHYFSIEPEFHTHGLDDCCLHDMWPKLQHLSAMTARVRP